VGVGDVASEVVEIGTSNNHSHPPLLLETRHKIEKWSWCQVVSAPSASTSLDQEFVEDFGRFLPVECLSWTVVEFVGDGVEFGLCVVR
jgi:hypothetical protein